MKKLTLSIFSLCIFAVSLFAEPEVLEISVNDFYNLCTSSATRSKALDIFNDYEKDTLRLVITDSRVNSEKFLGTLKSSSFNRPMILDLTRVSSVTQTLEFEWLYANFKEIIFPDVYISYKFNVADKVEKVRIPKAQTIISMYQFKRMNRLKEIEIPEGSKLSEIQWYAFNGTENIEKITNLPPTCKQLGSSAFQNQKKLKYIDLSNVEVIGKDAFSGCVSLEEVSLNEKLSDMNAFRGCNNIKKITIRNPKMKFEKGAFSGLKNLEEINLPEASDYIVKDGILMDKAQKKIFFVLAGSDNETIRIPDSVINIDEYAFASNNGIKKITNIPDLERIQNAFSGCKTLEEVEFRANVTEISTSNFANCESLKTFVFPKTIKWIGGGVFRLCKSLDNVVLPEGLRYSTIQEANTLSSLFYGCTSLKNITLPKDIPSIDQSMFAESGIEKINIPESVTIIGTSAFRKCEYLTEIVIPKNVTKISSSAFTDCSALKSVTLPKGLKIIGEEAFKGCAALELLEIPDSVTEIGEYFVSGTNITEIKIPASVKTIKRGVFQDAPSLKTVIYDGTSETFKARFDRKWLDGNDYLDINIVCSDKTFNLLELTKFYSAEELKQL